MAKKALVPLSGAETEILRLVWEKGSATVQNICDMLPRRRKITYATVQTLLRRLEKKGYIRHETVGKAHVFGPAVKQDDVISKAVGSFLDKLFGGDPVPLMQYLAKHDKITAADVEDLKKLTSKGDS
ncbi:MAG: BlaI/MecI/CopY family transcriptional regulator [Planctomycetota bacterium]|jgi:predicted transcriptional regulator